MAVVVAPRSFDRSRSGAITGPIWFEHAARDESRAAFPEQNWVDFPVVILGWWLEELGAFARGEQSEATCRFMDGPFECRIRRAAPSLIRVRCVGDYLNGTREVATFLAREASLHASVATAVDDVLAECGRRGWSGSDIQALRTARGGTDRAGAV
jgi:hypothetical protein